MTSYIEYMDKPGVMADDTALTAKVFYIDADKIEWERGKWQIRPGWEKATTDLFEGICRGLFVWRNNQAQPIAAVGTHTYAYALFDGDLYDITPVIEIGVATNPFYVTNGSADVKMGLADHDMIDDQRIRFPGETTVNGVDISATAGFEVTVDGVNTVTFTGLTAATSSGAGVGGTIDYDIFLPPGLVDGLGGAGFGVGGFGLGDFGEGADINELYPRTWCFDNFGQNLIGNPRGQGLYEWAPNYSSPELVTNGNFATDSDWAKGTGWSISGGAAIATAGSSSLLSSQLALELDLSAYNLLEFDVTRAAGAVTPELAGAAIGDAVNAAGRYRRMFRAAAGVLSFHKDAAFSGTIDNVEVRQFLEMVPIPNAPAQNSCMLVTAEDMIMVGGTIMLDTGVFDPRGVRWCARRNNQLWVPGFEEGNTSGQYRVAGCSRIVRMIQMQGEILILTDNTPTVARFNPDPNINYSFTPLVPGFPLVGPNAFGVSNGIAYWVTNVAFEIARYAGGAPQGVPNTMRRTLAANLARSQHDKIYGAAVGERQVQFLYPDARDTASAGGNECSRYAKLNHVEPAWDPGTFERSAWCTDTGFGYPLAAGLDGQLYYQEKGASADGGALGWFIESGAFILRDGRVASILGIIPDFKALLGGATLTIKTYGSPAAVVVEFGPYGITAATEKVDVRAQGKLISFRLEGEAAPASGRFGTMQIDVRDARCGR